MVQYTSVIMSVALLVAPALAAVPATDANAPATNDSVDNQTYDGVRCDLASFACKKLPFGQEFCCKEAGGSVCNWDPTSKSCKSS